MNVLINDKGELLEILQAPKEAQENESIVTLEGYYQVLNEQRYESAKWNFELSKWVGVGEIRPIEIPQISEVQELKGRVTNTEVDIVTLEETINTIFGGV